LANLQTKHFGEKIRLTLLDVDRFQTEIWEGKDVIVSEFGVLTRYEDGSVGVSIHYMSEPDVENKRYGHWLQESTQSMSIREWAESHSEATQTMDIFAE